MSREWAAVPVRWLTTASYRRLTPIGRGALLHALLLAGQTNPEATWRDRAHLDELMDLEGYGPETTDELLRLGWLAEAEDGTVIVPSWDEIQWPVSKAILRAYEAARKREWRNRGKVDGSLSDNSLSEQNKVNNTNKNTTGVPASPGLSRTFTPKRRPAGDDPSRKGGLEPVNTLLLGCANCGGDVPESEGRVTVYRGMPRMVHNVCLPLVAA